MQIRRIFSFLVLGLIGILSVAACAESPEPGLAPTQTLEGTPTATQPLEPATTTPGVTPLGEETMPVITEKAGTSGPTENRLVAQAKEDLAERLSITVEEVELVKFEAVVWPDPSMGCPQPGMKYIQVPQDGALIVLQAGGREYDYHSGGTRDPFLCEQTEKAPKITPLNPEEIQPTPGMEGD